MSKESDVKPGRSKDEIKSSFWHFPDRRCTACGNQSEHVGAILGLFTQSHEHFMLCRECADTLQRAAYCWKDTSVEIKEDEKKVSRGQCGRINPKNEKSLQKENS